MTDDIVLLTAELALSDGQSLKRSPSFRAINVPRHMADNIAKWYRASGWQVEITEQS